MWTIACTRLLWLRAMPCDSDVVLSSQLRFFFANCDSNCGFARIHWRLTNSKKAGAHVGARCQDVTDDYEGLY